MVFGPRTKIFGYLDLLGEEHSRKSCLAVELVYGWNNSVTIRPSFQLGVLAVTSIELKSLCVVIVSSSQEALENCREPGHL